jgi:hypothetical protein
MSRHGSSSSSAPLRLDLVIPWRRWPRSGVIRQVSAGSRSLSGVLIHLVSRASGFLSMLFIDPVGFGQHVCPKVSCIPWSVNPPVTQEMMHQPDLRTTSMTNSHQIKGVNLSMTRYCIDKEGYLCSL